MRAGRKNKKIPGIGDFPPILTGLKVLADSGAKYLVIGGVASNLHGLARATKDIDILIPKDLENTQQLLDALGNLMWGLSRELDAERVLSKPFTIIGDTPRVDLLLVAGRLTFEKAYPRRTERTIEGIRVPYISLDDLIESKRTDRPRDAVEVADLQRLQRRRRVSTASKK